ncbi:MAG: CocE/NonD family hydrolase, partial [Acidobacteriota bacterium]|nr:CocE/NonD family hydrolase [Acidobacteriota bacterium]
MPKLPATLLWFAFSTAVWCQPYPVTIDHGATARMRDGVRLAADIYRPGAEGKFPVLLERTPYNRAGDEANASRMASHGYVVIIQDTRGRFDSEGEFYPFRYESQDGYDTVEWAAALPYSDGKVGMFGGSYVGATQWLAAIAAPPHLVAVQPYVTASEYFDGWTYQSGAFEQWFASSWSSGLAIDTLRRKAGGLVDSKAWAAQLPVDSYRMLELPPVSALAPYYRDWVTHDTDDAYWHAWKISDHYQDLNIKALHSGGWNDIFLKGTLKNYEGMRRQSPARADQRLLIGPWAHAATSPEGKIGDVTFGKSAVLDSEATILKWADYTLKGVRNEYATGAPVRLFIMGENAWRDEHEF